MWNLIKEKRYKWTYLQNRNRLTDTENKLSSYQRGKVEGRDKPGAWDEHTHTTVSKINNLQGPAI